MKKLIPFSGGLDSTYLAWQELAYGHSVKLIYIEMEDANLAKRLIERQQAIKIYEKFNDFYGKKVEFKIVHVKDFTSSDIFSWFRKGCEIALKNVNDIDELNFGYISDDIDRNPEKMPNRLKKLREQFPSIKIEFPLLKLSKNDVVTAIPKYLLELVFSCEAPVFKNTEKGTEVHLCEECFPCTDGVLWGVHDGKTKKFLLDIQLDEKEIGSCNMYHDICLLQSKGIENRAEIAKRDRELKPDPLIETFKRLSKV